MPVQWPNIEFTVNPGGSHLRAGRLSGSVSGSTVINQLIPNLASIFTLYIKTNPGSESSRTIQSLFDTGGCTNPDGTTAVKGDGTVGPCELSQSPLIKALFAPDVQLRDASGKFRPVPGEAQRDSLSLGVGFTAGPLGRT